MTDKGDQRDLENCQAMHCHVPHPRAFFRLLLSVLGSQEEGLSRKRGKRNQDANTTLFLFSASAVNSLFLVYFIYLFIFNIFIRSITVYNGVLVSAL